MNRYNPYERMDRLDPPPKYETEPEMEVDVNGCGCFFLFLSGVVMFSILVVKLLPLMNA